ncbi:uracil-DNA glycosylase, partial [bacterium]
LERSIEATLRFAHQSGAWIVPSRPRTAEATAEKGLPEDLESLRFALEGCQRCNLAAGRTNIVFGVGNPSAEILFVGEGPGENEDLRGEPFVGRAGELLNKMIAAIGLAREKVYIANVVKCRPPQNRDPAEEEIQSCLPFLLRQIEIIKPKAICALGRHAAHSLLKTKASTGELRGKTHDFCGMPLVVTYHPAYLLRSPLEKRKAWEDLKLLAKTAGL